MADEKDLTDPKLAEILTRLGYDMRLQPLLQCLFRIARNVDNPAEHAILGLEEIGVDYSAVQAEIDGPPIVLEPYQARVVDEKAELDQKLSDLRSFLGSDAFNNLPAAEQSRLREQSDIMAAYTGVLDERIQAFPVKVSVDQPAEEIAPMKP